MTEPPAKRAVSAFYSASVTEFLECTPNEILGQLSTSHDFPTLELTQIAAWQEEVGILQQSLVGVTGSLFIEFDVPRLGSRIDAVLVAGAAVIPIEFKCGESRFTTDAKNQVWDYALDLKNFHQASHEAAIFPIVVATGASSGDVKWEAPHADGVRPPRRVVVDELAAAVGEAITQAQGPPIDGPAWGSARYHPTPTIIEAARALYSRHSVDAITRNDAGAKNLSLTSSAVEEVIEWAQRERQKAIVFVTGVPGAGKTLVGLDVATRRREMGDARAVFLSGNGPLVDVLREALARDELKRQPTTRKGVVRQMVKPFIQNVHHFRDDGLRSEDAPFDHVVIFDEAQRAWDRNKTAHFMRRKKGRPNFTKSEPEFLISYLNRHPAWAVVICLVGGGQEINTGEAGISAWLEAVDAQFRGWRTFISPNLVDSEYSAESAISALSTHAEVVRNDKLHLATSMRSFRTERLSGFVKAVLDCDTEEARSALGQFHQRYPIVVTRDLRRAKQWVREHARGSEQTGLVASSQAMRLKPHAIDIRVNVDPVHYFLADRADTRSSSYLEDAATEFQIQGLELDWICVNWDADLRRHQGAWRFHSFRGDKWVNVRSAVRQRYLLNAYRVLLTRARQGMVIFVPPGDADDATREPSFYDETYSYLIDIGISAT